MNVISGHRWLKERPAPDREYVKGKRRRSWPEEHCLAGPLRAIVTDNDLGQSASSGQSIQFAGREHTYDANGNNISGQRIARVIAAGTTPGFDGVNLKGASRGESTQPRPASP